MQKEVLDPSAPALTYLEIMHRMLRTPCEPDASDFILLRDSRPPPISVWMQSFPAELLCILQLPKRLARRLMDLQFLPHIVVTNPHIRRVYNAYHHAFDTLRQMPEVKYTSERCLTLSCLLRRLHAAS